MNPALNWREIARIAEILNSETRDAFVERVFVPERPSFAQQFLKNEWALKLTQRREEKTLLVSVRPKHTFSCLISGRGPKLASRATHSAFDLSLGKYLKGTRVQGCEALPRERVMAFWFQGELGLVLSMIPAMPEAFLIRREQAGWLILTRSRNVSLEGGPHYFPTPTGGNPPADPPIRESLAGGMASFCASVEQELELEAFEGRRATATRTIESLVKQLKDKLRQSETALREAEREPDWKRYGDLLKGSMGLSEITDFETGERVELPLDPKLSVQAQIEKFYSNAKRKQRRMLEARNRAEQSREQITKLSAHLSVAIAPLDWARLEKLESITARTGARPEAPSAKKGSGWLGKSFLSKDGIPIWVGKSRDENLELTFKHARGNHLWMHVRGRPGAHTVLPLSPGKSAPLETLLDAAVLTIFYSGGESWGKTEVDYTFKKFVKRIKDSKEVSYTQNKTLVVEPDPKRLKRLLEQLA